MCCASCGRLGFEQRGDGRADAIGDALTGDAGDSGVAPNCSPVYNFMIGTSKYEYFTGVTMDWLAAEAMCEADGVGMHLAVIETAAEADAVGQFALDRNVWIGVSDRVTAGTWLRVIGSSETNLPWAASNPQGTGQCVEWHTQQKNYTNELCTTLVSPICECDGIAANSTTY